MESLHEFVVGRLQAEKGRWKDIAEASGVDYDTLKKIATGETRDPGVSKVEKLARYFRQRKPS